MGCARCRCVYAGRSVSRSASARAVRSSSSVESTESASRRHLLAHVQAQVQRDLVVARARGVQEAGALTEDAGDRPPRPPCARPPRPARTSVPAREASQMATSCARMARASSEGMMRVRDSMVRWAMLPTRSSVQEGLVERQRAGECQHLGVEAGPAGGGRLGNRHGVSSFPKSVFNFLDSVRGDFPRDGATKMVSSPAMVPRVSGSRA